LASLRRAVGGLLVGVGAIIVVLSQCIEAQIGRPITILASAWIVAFLLMVGVLRREWRNRRLTESLHLACLDDDGVENRAGRSGEPIRAIDAIRAVTGVSV
jgi:hypothetical protein